VHRDGLEHQWPEADRDAGVEDQPRIGGQVCGERSRPGAGLERDDVAGHRCHHDGSGDEWHKQTGGPFGEEASNGPHLECETGACAGEQEEHREGERQQGAHQGERITLLRVLDRPGKKAAEGQQGVKDHDRDDRA
jgi:hypothetical protein